MSEQKKIVAVRISDNRYLNGYKIKFFHADSITEEVIRFVLNNPNAYWVDGNNETYHSREEFLKEYGQYKKTVKELRKETGMSQGKFAAYFGIPARTLQEWEQEKRNPQEYVVDMMERILKNEFFGKGEGNKDEL